jgi:hypothetical protein
VNTGAIVEHDCRLGAHAHISPAYASQPWCVSEKARTEASEPWTSRASRSARAAGLWWSRTWPTEPRVAGVRRGTSRRAAVHAPLLLRRRGRKVPEKGLDVGRASLPPRPALLGKD